MRGGSRPGAGRPAGAASRKTRDVANKAAESGMTPLDFLLLTMRDEKLDFSVRLDAAKAASPYVHPRLATIQHQGDEDKPLSLIVRSGVPRAEGD